MIENINVCRMQKRPDEGLGLARGDNSRELLVDGRSAAHAGSDIDVHRTIECSSKGLFDLACCPHLRRVEDGSLTTHVLRRRQDVNWVSPAGEGEGGIVAADESDPGCRGVCASGGILLTEVDECTLEVIIHPATNVRRRISQQSMVSQHRKVGTSRRRGAAAGFGRSSGSLCTHPVPVHALAVDQLPAEGVGVGRDAHGEPVDLDEALRVDERGVVGGRGGDVGARIAD